MMNTQFRTLSLALLMITLSACSGGGVGGSSDGGTTAGNPFTEDNSTSGSVAGAVGGALSGTSSGGTLASFKHRQHLDSISLALQSLGLNPQAQASNPCPSFLTAPGVLCSTSGGQMELIYNNCQFAGSQAQWSGALALIKSTGTATCGTFPNPGNNATLTRQYVEALHPSVPSTAEVVSSFGTSLAVDDTTLNLNNFDNQPISTLVNGGYGTTISYNASDKRTALTIAQRIYNGSYDHSMSGSLTLNETTPSSRTVTGSVSVYHNLARVVGTSVFSNVVHGDMCCLPISGSITTTFSAGQSVSPTPLGSLLVGHSETLTFTGCGTATLQSYDGTVKNVSLSRCF